MHAEHEPEARRRLEVLAKSYGAKYPKVATCLHDDFAPIQTRTDAMKRLRTGEFATAVTHALILKLAPWWRRLRGYRELADLKYEAIASRRAA